MQNPKQKKRGSLGLFALAMILASGTDTLLGNGCEAKVGECHFHDNAQMHVEGEREVQCSFEDRYEVSRADMIFCSTEDKKKKVQIGEPSGELLEKMIGTDDFGRPQPFCRLASGCSATFTAIKGELFVLTALHCIDYRNDYQIEVFRDGQMVQTVTGTIAKLSRVDDIALLRVDEGQFNVLPRSFKLSAEWPKPNELVVVAGAWAGSGIPKWNPGSRNTAIRVLRVGSRTGQHHWELQDAAWPGASGGGIVSVDGKLLGVMSTTDSRGISTFTSVSALGMNKANQEAVESPKSMLYLVTQPSCQPCEKQKQVLKSLNVRFEEVEYPVAKSKGWSIEKTPTLVATENGEAKAYLIGRTTNKFLVNWLETYSPNSVLAMDGCDEDECPLPESNAKEIGTTAKNQGFFLFVIVFLAIYSIWSTAHRKIQL